MFLCSRTFAGVSISSSELVVSQTLVNTYTGVSVCVTAPASTFVLLIHGGPRFEIHVNLYLCITEIIMAQYRPPASLNFDEPKWDVWKAKFSTFRLVTKLHKEGSI